MDDTKLRISLLFLSRNSFVLSFLWLIDWDIAEYEIHRNIVYERTNPYFMPPRRQHLSNEANDSFLIQVDDTKIQISLLFLFLFLLQKRAPRIHIPRYPSHISNEANKIPTHSFIWVDNTKIRISLLFPFQNFVAIIKLLNSERKVGVEQVNGEPETTRAYRVTWCDPLVEIKEFSTSVSQGEETCEESQSKRLSSRRITLRKLIQSNAHTISRTLF